MAPLTPLFHWSVPAPYPVSQAVIDDARARGLSARLIRVLSRRGPLDAGALAARFDAPESALHDPRLLPDAGRAVARVDAAVAAGERVLVLGDFDADGLTGLAILVLALRYRGLDVEPYVPARTEEGHGLSRAAVEAARAAGRSLILTADTGSTSHDEIEEARRSGIDVVVTDHHQLPGGPPDAAAVINPHRADSSYPDRRLSGSGVAFKVAQLLLADQDGGADYALGLADLAAIGSIADVVPLEGENRAITRIGLRLLSEGGRPGLAALLVSAGVSPDRVSPETISFALAPRINALGRVGHALDAALLLLEDDPDRIAQLVARMEAANVERRGLMTAALAEARATLGDDDGAPVTIVAGPWAPGVVGLVAGRLADQLGRPAIVFSTTVDPWRGSARSAGGFDLGAAFAANAGLFERHGGHAAAAGCHLDPARYAEFRSAMLACFTDAPPIADRRRTLILDLVVSAGSVDHVLLAELMPLDGVGDEPPLLGIAGLSVARARAANGGHTQLTLRKGMEVLDGICFGRSDLVDMLREGDLVDVAGRLSSRRFGGLETLQLEVRDVAPAGHLASIRSRPSVLPDPAGRLAVDPARGDRGGRMSGSGQDPRAPGGWPSEGGGPRTPWVPDPGGWPAPPPAGPSTQGWRDPRTGRWQGGDTTDGQATGPPTGQPDPGVPLDAGTGQWQATGSSAWGGVPGVPVRPQGAPPPPPRGGGTSAPILAPLVALLGLALVAGGSVFAASQLELVGGAAVATSTPEPDFTDGPLESYDPDATDTPGPVATPTPRPTAFLTPPPNEQATVPGTLLYVRDGDIWAVEDTSSRQVSGKGTNSSPTWSDDGQTIYFVQTKLERGRPTPWGRLPGRPNDMTHYATDVMSMNADGSDRTRLFTSMRKAGSGFWSTVAVQPDLSPNGRTLVLVSDMGEVPTADTSLASVLLATMTATGKNLKSMGIDSFDSTYGPLGHNDPAWSPDGKSIAFTYNAKGGGKGAGASQVGVISAPFRKRQPDLSRKGYANPTWSPDGRYIAAERMTENSRDIVVLDPRNWEEVARLTTDGRSFAPEWSPNGDQIAYLRSDGLAVDVRVMTLDLAGNLTLIANQAVTVDGNVDPASSPAWFIPADERRALPTPAPGPETVAPDPAEASPAADGTLDASEASAAP